MARQPSNIAKKRANLAKALGGGWSSNNSNSNSNSNSNIKRKRAGNNKIPVYTRVLMNEMWKRNTSNNNRQRNLEKKKRNASMKPTGFGFL